MRRGWWVFFFLAVLPLPYGSVQGQEAVRVTVGGGYGIGSNSGAYDINHGTLDLEAVTGGAGPVLAAGIWLDDVGYRDLSLGLQLLRLMNSARASLDLPRGISILKDPTSGGAKLSADATLAFLDVVYRPVLPGGVFAFYLGGGLGGGTGKAGASFSLYNPATGWFSQQASVSAPVGALHAVMGIELHLTETIFVSIAPQIVYLTGHPAGIRQSYADAMVVSSLGFSF